jgi:urease accessory protein
MKSRFIRIIPSVFCFLLPSVAQAHTGIAPAGGFVAGMAHPLGGPDHLLAMAAVGIWAAQMGQRSLWAVPLAFVSMMALGGALGVSGMSLPFGAQGIVVSVLALGILIAAAVRLPLPASAAIAGLFGVFHGYAHGAEMPGNVSGMAYGLGFVLSTALLHLSGIGCGLLLRRIAGLLPARVAGAAIAALGGYWCWAVQ